MKILVTGGAGFIGSHVVDMLIEYDYDVIIVDNFCTGKKVIVHPQVRLIKMDINSPTWKKYLGVNNQM